LEDEAVGYNEKSEKICRQRLLTFQHVVGIKTAELIERKNRGERIRTSGLLVPKQIQVLVETRGSEWILDAFD
jgi:hypothetical protein